MYETGRPAPSGIARDEPTDRIAALPFVERGGSPVPGPAAISGGSAPTIHRVAA